MAAVTVHCNPINKDELSEELFDIGGGALVCVTADDTDANHLKLAVAMNPDRNGVWAQVELDFKEALSNTKGTKKSCALVTLQPTLPFARIFNENPPKASSGVVVVTVIRQNQ